MHMLTNTIKTPPCFASMPGAQVIKHKLI